MTVSSIGKVRVASTIVAAAAQFFMNMLERARRHFAFKKNVPGKKKL